VDHIAFPLVIGGIGAVLATTFGLFPERPDVTHMFAAYGAGAICGEAVAARHPWVDSSAMMRRWGSLWMAAVGFIWDARLAVGITLSQMDPRVDRMNRRFRRAVLVGLPVWVVVAVVAVVDDWSLGWIYLAIAAVLGTMMLYTHHEPRDRARRR
jgi:hypothetical protein